MEPVVILIKQLLIMALYCMVGFVLHKRKMISKEGCSAFSTFLLYVILPCVIISSFLRATTAETTRKLLTSLLLSAVLLAISMLLSHVFFRKTAVDEFSSSFSNAGFMGIPLISSVLGSEAVFLTAGLVALLNILQWTYGVTLLLPCSKTKPFKVLKNPLVISLLIGFAVYFLPVHVPTLLEDCLLSIAKCNSPIAMFVLGYYIAEIPFRSIMFNSSTYPVSVVRLLLIPAISLVVLYCIPSISSEFKYALLIAASCPVGINVAIYAEKAGNDYHRAVAAICQSTVLSLVTLPLMMLFSSMLF